MIVMIAAQNMKTANDGAPIDPRVRRTGAKFEYSELFYSLCFDCGDLLCYHNSSLEPSSGATMSTMVRRWSAASMGSSVRFL